MTTPFLLTQKQDLVYLLCAGNGLSKCNNVLGQENSHMHLQLITQITALY